MRTRDAEDRDVDAWAELRHELWPDCPLDTCADEARAILESPEEACFVLEDASGALVGFAEAALHEGSDGPYAHLEGWYVRPEHRGSGRGQALAERVEQWCLHRAIRVLTSDTTPDYPLSPAAHARAGFRKLHELTIFVKELPGEGDGKRRTR